MNANTENQRKPVSQAFRQDVEKLLSLGWKKDAWGAWINPENGAHFTFNEAIKHRSNTEAEAWSESFKKLNSFSVETSEIKSSQPESNTESQEELLQEARKNGKEYAERILPAKHYSSELAIQGRLDLQHGYQAGYLDGISRKSTRPIKTCGIDCGCIDKCAAENQYPKDTRQDERDELIKELKQTLENIVNPIKYLQDKAKAEGASLNGMMAINLSKDPAFLRSLALEALERLESKERVN